MIDYVAFNRDSGEIESWGRCEEENLPLLQAGGVEVVPGVGRPETHWVDGDRLIQEYGPGARQAKADRPSQVHRWSNETFAWRDPRPLETLKQERLAWAEAERERRGYLPIEYAGALFDAHGEGQRNIFNWQLQINSGVLPPAGFMWKDHLNAYHAAEDPAFIIGLGAAITMRGTLLYQRWWQLKDQVDAATTADQLAQIGWPGSG